MHDLKFAPVQERSLALYVKAGVVVVLTALTAAICLLTPPGKVGGEAGVEMDLPTKVGDLYDRSEEVSKEELYILPKDTTFARKTYGDIGAMRQDRILCSIILSGAERRSIHRPERCLPGQGWHIDGSHVETIPLASGRNLSVTALLLERPVTLTNGRQLTIRSYYLYWFVGKGISTPSHFTRIMMTYWDMMINRVNQRWAYVIVSKDITKDFESNGLDADETLAQLKKFIHDSVPYYMKSEMPEEKTASR